MRKHRLWKLAVGALALTMGTAACSDWLTSRNAQNNPNSPTTASTANLITGIETNLTVFLTGDLDRLFMIWMQQMGGSDRQYLAYASYSLDEDAFAPDWAAVYTGGGLFDIRTVQQSALAAGDSLTAGIAYVLEALDVGTAADIWGDIPYSQAVSDVLQPALDPQQQVYATVQAKLDTALLYMACTSISCGGPGSADVWAGGDPTVWIPVAHTLKARFWLHVAEQLGTPAYDSAAAEAAQGIPDPSHNLETWQSTNPNERNLFYQFMVLQRSGYMSAGEFLVNLLKTTSDPRLTKYFTTNSAGVYVGAPPGGAPGDYSTLAGLNSTDTTLAGAQNQRVPLVTYAENELILAEALLQTGNAAGAAAAYSAERASQGLPGAGAVTLAQIITEKYIADFFMGIETWNDWKRTCIPLVGAAPGSAGIPGRLLYPLSTERNANPNIPPPNAQPTRNWNDPNTCPDEQP